MNVKKRLYVGLGLFISSVVLSIVWTGGTEIETVALLYFAITMNIFSIPLVFLTPVFEGIPLWVWYVIVVEWVGVWAAVVGVPDL